MDRLAGKVALITGAGSGIGLETARLFAAEGATVIVADADQATGAAAANELRARDYDTHFVAADVSDDDQAKAMIDFATDTCGRLDVLFNNAGIMPANDGSTTETPVSTWERVIDVNLKGVWLGCKHAIPVMHTGGGGSIVNAASIVALMGAATAQIAYTASKGGVLSMTREIAVENARRGIRVNALCPGPIDTPLLAELLRDPEQRARRFVHIPMGRLGQAKEIAKAALFLASDDSSFMTGSALVVDGGITAAYVTPEDES
jgi:NAD(P)-dependent dehydrogenase (short-subunit alcohol dehydrogenase family)